MREIAGIGPDDCPRIERYDHTCFIGYGNFLGGTTAPKSGKSRRTSQALPIRQELLERRQTEYVPAYFVAQVFLGVGEKEDALHWLQTAFGERSHWVLFLKVDPIFDELRSDTRFLDLSKQVDQKQE